MDLEKVLAIDIGNTHCVVGYFHNKKLINQWRISSGINRTEDEFGSIIGNLLSLQGVAVKEIGGVAISSVVPNLTFGMSYMAEKYFNCKPFIIDSSVNLGMRIRYSDPSSVGADRLCNSVAAIKKYGKPLVIIDFGTATTFDCINRAGDYMGGVISPGIQTSISALHSKAAKLPLVELNFPPHLIGSTTDESIQSGILNGAVFMINGLTEKLKEILGSKTKIIATGGLADKIAGKTESINIVDRHLCLEGILLIFDKNRTRV